MEAEGLGNGLGTGSSPAIASKYKIVFLGDAFVGKTCLINRFIYDTFDVGYQVQNWRGENSNNRSLSELISCLRPCTWRIKR